MKITRWEGDRSGREAFGEAFTYETTHTPKINAIINFIPKDDFRGTIGKGSVQGIRRRLVA